MRTRRGLLVAVLALVALVGCSSGAGDSDSADGAGGGMASEVDAGGADVAMDTTGTDQREVIVTASAAVVVDDPSTAADAVAGLAAAAGGRVEGRDEQAGGGEDGEPGWATLVLRVPADDLSSVLADLDDIGTVSSVSQSEEDVTGTVVDLDARIEALQTSTARLLKIMSDADDTGDLLAVETQLSERQAELEALQSQRDALGDQVAMATLTVSLDAAPIAAAEARGGFLGGLESGWNALLSFVGGLLVAVGALLPWVVALGVPALAVLAVARRRRPPAAGQSQ